MEERSGDYHFQPPVNVPGGEMIVPDASWFECGGCNKQLLPASLDNKLEELYLYRTNNE